MWTCLDPKQQKIEKEKKKEINQKAIWSNHKENKAKLWQNIKSDKINRFFEIQI